MPQYPYDRANKKIILPDEAAKELKKLYANSDPMSKKEAMKKTMGLTGAGLKMAKEFLDGL
ncbi:MAG: hypothetical protein ABIH39_06695 [Candidatus Margulisiibacteriota bacterium]